MSAKRWQRRIVVGAATLAAIVLLLIPWRNVYLHLLFIRDFEYVGPNSWGCPEYRHRATGIVFVRVPGGTFTMGSSERDVEQAIDNWIPLQMLWVRFNLPSWDRRYSCTREVWEREFRALVEKEEVPHRVTLDSFLLAKYELSQSEWDAVMRDDSKGVKESDSPVDNISWEDCREFCGRTGLQLPTEAQWEFAAKGGRAGLCWYGPLLPGFDPEMTPQSFWERWSEVAPSTPKTREDPLGESGFGFFNMYGGFREFCQDWYDPAFYRTPSAREKNPVCSATSPEKLRVVRGCSDLGPPLVWRAASRGWCDPTGVVRFITLRPAYYPLP